MQNRRIFFVQPPKGPVTPACYDVRDEPVPEPQDGDVLVRNIYLSCDPYMRGRMGGTANYPGSRDFPLDEVIPARVVGQVAESRNRKFKKGDFVWGFLGWELYSLAKGGGDLRVVDPSLGPISHAITVIGMPGLTARVGILDIGKPKPGETAFISAASGAVGSVAGQIAKQAGCTVVGSAGSDRKVRHIVDVLGFDAAFNYKTVPSIGAALDEHCPNGIDIYFENVGGETLEAVLDRINPGARIPVCGSISQYDNPQPSKPKNIGNVEAKGAVMRKFSIYDHMDQYDDFLPWIAERVSDGRIVYFEDIVDGFDNTIEAFIGMMKGDNLGKRLVRVSDDPTLG
jgi:NADPH-dependent curcumin reductase CurA